MDDNGRVAKKAKTSQRVLSASLKVVSREKVPLPDHTTTTKEIEDRGSRFKGYFIQFDSNAQLEPMRQAIDHLPELSKADHKISAWRVHSDRVHDKVVTGWDDDGEKWAGDKVLGILKASEQFGLVVVVRWYGGVMLGPRRFEHIVDVAADAIVTYKANVGQMKLTLTPPSSQAAHSDQQQQLQRQLVARDLSIANLRKIVESKRPSPSPSSSPTKAAPTYDDMSVDQLKNLLKARDNTIEALRKIIRAT